MFSCNLKSIINSCLTGNRQFAVYALPGHEPTTIVSGDIKNSSDATFFINGFNNSFISPIEITAGKANSLDKNQTCPEPYNTSTPYEVYISHVSSIIDELKISGGKTVFSRTLCGDRPGADWADIADRYFHEFPETFRFIYYTPLTGAWLGASPEILLERNTGSNRVSTMALAGTTDNDSTHGWDIKNRKEHDFVTQYISDTFRELGIEPIISPDENVKFGIIKHLCNRISGEYSGDFFKAVNALSPTPALAGVPLSEALKHIRIHEAHSRLCYGGYVGVIDSCGEHAYVNLRSVHFSGNRFCMYLGGGITADSKPEDEWAETYKKGKKLYDIILTGVMDYGQ